MILALRAHGLELESSAAVQQSASSHTCDSHVELLSVLEHLPVMFAAVNADRQIVFWNHQCELITGYSKAEILNNSGWVQLLYPDTEYVERKRRERMSMGENYRQETQIRCKDGSIRTIAWLSDAGEMPLLGWASWAVGIRAGTAQC